MMSVVLKSAFVWAAHASCAGLGNCPEARPIANANCQA